MSELQGHLCPYRNVLPEDVYCCFTRTTLQTCNFPIPWLLWISISTQCFVSQLPLVIEIDTLVETEEEQQQQQRENEE